MSDHIDELLARARDGELSFTQRRTLDAHLATCPRCATLARQLERNDVLLATRERPLAPAPFDPAATPREGVPIFAFVSVAAVVVLVVLVTASGLLGIRRLDVAAPSQAVIVSRAPSPSALASSGASSTQVPSPSVQPTPSPSYSAPLTPSGLPGIATAPLGEVHGGWAIALRHYRNAASSTPMDELFEVWATPLDASRPPVLTVTLHHPTIAGVPEGGVPNGVTLRQIFSADGRQIVVNDLDYGIAVIDLPGGKVRSLGVTGYGPIMTRDGAWIAFARTAGLDQYGYSSSTLWVIPTSGGQTPRQIPGARALGLAGGSRLVVLSAAGDAAVIDAASGAPLGAFPATSGTIPGTFAWREGTPAFTLISLQSQQRGGGLPDDVNRIEVMNDDLSNRRVLLEHTASYYESQIDQVRWNPVTDELLYFQHNNGGSTTGVIAVATRAVQVIAATAGARIITWDQNGADLVGLVRDAANTPVPSALPSNFAADYGRYALAVIGRDGSVRRMFPAISVLEPFENMQDVVTISY